MERKPGILEKGLFAVVALALVASAIAGMRAAERQASTGGEWDMLQAKPEVVKAWQDMRFGMFICWGPVSLTGLEIGWSRVKAHPDQKQGGRGPTPVEVYDNLYKKWKPDKFDAGEWVSLAQESGARYIIFLVKHHDGFALYDTKLTDHRITAPESAWKVDVLKAMADACHKAGMKLIIYYSQPDWHHPDYRTARHGRYVKYLHGQIREILTNYGRIDGLWFDGLGGTAEDWDAANLFKMARQLQPHLIINARCGLPGDFDTPEQRIGKFQADRPWETCMTLGAQWSWKPDDKIKSLKECIEVLATCAVRDGNLALNTNPMPDGRIEPRQAERFREIGRWLAKCGESIYGTRGGPFRAQTDHWWGGSTRKANVIYLHILQWPSEAIVLPAIPRRIIKSSALNGADVTVKQTAQAIEVSVPPGQRDSLDTIVKLELDGPAGDIPILSLTSGSLTAGRKAAASDYYRKEARFGPDKAVDDDLSTRWGCDRGTYSCWLEVDLGEPKTFDHTFISEPYGRVRKFELQAKRGERWETFYSGATIGEDFRAKFPPVTARHVRLNITETDGPSIWEFQLFSPQKPR